MLIFISKFETDKQYLRGELMTLQNVISEFLTWSNASKATC